MPCPYHVPCPYTRIQNDDNPVNVFRHNHKFIQCGTREMIGDCYPTIVGDPAKIMEYRFPGLYFAGQTLPFVCANGCEIRAGPRITVSRQADGTAMMSVVSG